jgi:hypothetical protein
MTRQTRSASRQTGMALMAVLGFMMVVAILLAASGTRAKELTKKINFVEKQQLRRDARQDGSTIKRDSP